MSKRLQVILPEDQYAQVAAAARREGLTIAAWVRGLLAAACRTRPTGSTARKIAAIRAAYTHQFPTADIEDMLDQIESGYLAGDD